MRRNVTPANSGVCCIYIYWCKGDKVPFINFQIYEVFLWQLIILPICCNYAVSDPLWRLIIINDLGIKQMASPRIEPKAF